MTTYDPFSELLEDVILRAQRLRREHTDSAYDLADRAMADAASLIVRRALTDPGSGTIGKADRSEVVVTGNFRRVTTSELSKLITAFGLAHTRRQHGGEHDVLKIYGYAREAEHLARFAESAFVQARSTTDYLWLNDPQRGHVDLRAAYGYQRGYTIQLIERIVRQVQYAYSIETTTTTSQLLRRRLAALDPTALD
jgi:hypothetical protein